MYEFSKKRYVVTASDPLGGTYSTVYYEKGIQFSITVMPLCMKLSSFKQSSIKNIQFSITVMSMCMNFQSLGR